MLLQGGALFGTLSMNFSISGEAGDWKVSVSAPGNIAGERSTDAPTPYVLLDEMLADTVEVLGRRHPQRVIKARR